MYWTMGPLVPENFEVPRFTIIKYFREINCGKIGFVHRGFLTIYYIVLCWFFHGNVHDKMCIMKAEDF